KGIIIGTGLILIAYAVLPKAYQFSRLFIFLGALWAFIYYITSRLFLHFFTKGRFTLFRAHKQSYAVIARGAEYNRISELLKQTQTGIGSIEEHSIDKVLASTKREIIFSAEMLDYKRIIEKMKELHLSEHDFKIAPPKTSILIGSNSIDTAGDLYLLDLNALNSNENARKKRLFDISISILFFIISPILIFRFKQKIHFFRNCWSVLYGKRSFVGYSDTEMKTDVRLPKTKIGLLSPAEAIDDSSKGLREKLNLLYARDYSMRKDLSIVLKSWNKLDN
ncbi:MAG: hypothetical protein MK066_13175, partial [Crocinitomicaceae bacterium]|nr:hypothetical protein [Crocinitomicaceae bacterium]